MKKILILIIIQFFLFSCSDNDVAGGGIDVANGYISGIITTSNNSSNNNIIVKLLPDNFNPQEEILPDTLIDTTNANGEYSIGPIDSGSYNIVARTLNNSHSGFIDNIFINDTNLTVNKAIDTNSLILLILEDSLYGLSKSLYIEGSDIWITIPDTSCTLFLELPLDTLPPLKILSENGQSDTLLSTIPIGDSLINLSNTITIETYDTIGTFYHWTNLGIASDTATQLLMDSSYNVWAISNSSVTCLLVDSIGVLINAVYYITDVFSDSLNQITCAAISPIGEMWIGTNGMGIYRRLITSEGTLIGGNPLTNEIYLYIPSDTISSIDFIDSTILVASSHGANYGNYYLNDNSVNIPANNGQVISNSLFWGLDNVFFIEDSVLETYNITSEIFNTSPLGYDIGSDKIQEMNVISRDEIHLFYQAPTATGRKVTILNNTTQQLKEYSFSYIGSNISVTSSVIDNDGNEWFGLSNGSIIKIYDGDENNYRIFNSQNSNLNNSTEYVNAMIITSHNRLYATVGLLGFFDLDLNPQ